jgi:hypothetical protein
MPAALNGRMTEREWELFCSQVDEHIAPLNQFRCLVKVAGVGFFLEFIIISIFLATSTNPAFFFFLIQLGLIIGMSVLACCVSYVGNRAFDRVRQLCEAFSRNNHNITLHLRCRRLGQDMEADYYIEASLSEISVVPFVTDDQIACVEVDPMNDLETGYLSYISTAYEIKQVPSAYEKSINVSAEQRLEKLQRTKHLLTTEEYNRKREEILADI